MRITIAVLALAAALGLTAGALAEKPDMKPDSLRKIATHVVVGEVKAVYTRQHMEGRMRVTRYLAEVEVKTVEKGDGLEAGALAYVRYWTQEWTGSPEKMPAGTTGHRRLPSEGETLRIYLAKNAYDGFGDDNDDGGLNVIGANGFERLEAGEGK
jgi:hypothetical protein